MQLSSYGLSVAADHVLSIRLNYYNLGPIYNYEGTCTLDHVNGHNAKLIRHFCHVGQLS